MTDLSTLLEEKFSLLDLSLIKEDVNQPREYFDETKLEDLTRSIKERGVKTPISVRVDPKDKFRYIINHGARRFRASEKAGLKVIPAYIDNDYESSDQLTENIQRSDLTPREIANGIDKELKKGLKKGEVARLMGVSNAYISQHITLLDLPELISEAFNNKRITDVTLINELVNLYKEDPDKVKTWLDDEDIVFTRGTLKLLKEYSEQEQNNNNELVNTDDETVDHSKKKNKEADPDKMKKAIINVTHNHHGEGRIILNKRPTDKGLVWINFNGEEKEVSASTLTIDSIIEG